MKVIIAVLLCIAITFATPIKLGDVKYITTTSDGYGSIEFSYKVTELYKYTDMMVINIKAKQANINSHYVGNGFTLILKDSDGYEISTVRFTDCQSYKDECFESLTLRKDTKIASVVVYAPKSECNNGYSVNNGICETNNQVRGLYSCVDNFPPKTYIELLITESYSSLKIKGIETKYNSSPINLGSKQWVLNSNPFIYVSDFRNGNGGGSFWISGDATVLHNGGGNLHAECTKLHN